MKLEVALVLAIGMASCGKDSGDDKQPSENIALQDGDNGSSGPNGNPDGGPGGSGGPTGGSGRNPGGAGSGGSSGADPEKSKSLCRTDEDGKAWCLADGEWPSDTDPTKKVKRCKTGLFDHDECKPITLEYVKGEHVALYAGDRRRIYIHRNADKQLKMDLVDLKQDSFWEFVFPYYLTKYDMNIFKSYSDDEYLISPLSSEIQVEFRKNDAPPFTAKVFGKTIVMGKMTLDAFKELCAFFATQEPWWEYKTMNLDAAHWCTKSSSSMALRCDANDEHCSIKQARFSL